MNQITVSLTYGAIIALQPLIGGEKSSSGAGFTADKWSESSESSLDPMHELHTMRTGDDGDNGYLRFEVYQDPACAACLGWSEE